MNKKFIKKAATLALGVGLVSSSLLTTYLPLSSKVHAATNSTAESILAKLTPEQRQALEKLSTANQTGLFLNSNVNLESTNQVKVIVAFKQKPHKVAVLEAAVEGKSLSDDKAKSNVEADHETFKNDLGTIFKDKADGSYKVKHEYKHAFNGVAVEVPANKLKDLMKSDAVQAIYSDSTVNSEPLVEEAVPSKEAKGQGMAAERSFLNVDKLHDEGYTGKGVKVAVLDTGVDYNHPDIKDAYKGGYDFIDNDNDPMETTYQDYLKYKAANPTTTLKYTDYVTEHGTHVSGTIAGQGKNDSEYATTGIAPDADLYVYRVLGPGGSGATAGIIAGIDQAVADGMNLSLGADYNDPLIAESIAINNAVLSGVTAVVAAGNAGNKMYTVGSPGAAALALTVGASDVPTQIPTMKGHLDSVNSDMRMLARGFNDSLSTLLGKTYQIVNINNYGQANDYRNLDVTGKVVLVQRGTSSINDKILQAKLKNAAAILIYENVADEGYMPYYLAEGADFIPSFNLTKADGLALKQKIAAGNTQFTFSDLGQLKTQGDTLADFSSRGPSRATYDIKPEVTAPGVSVLSTVPGFLHSPSNPTDYQFAYEHMSGTSMATPFTTGVAALLLQAQPDLQPEDVKSILMNTADPLSKPYSVFEQGAGRVDPEQAIHSTMEIIVKDKTPTTINGREKQINEDTGALSFGNVAFNGKDIQDSRSVTLENKGKEDKTFDISVKFQTDVRGAKDAAKNGVEVTTDQSIKVPANSNVTRNVSLSIPTTAEKGIYEGYIVYTNHDEPSETYRVPFGAHFVEEGFQEFSLDRQLVSTDRNALGQPFYATDVFSKLTLKSHMKYIDAVVMDATTGEDLGLIGTADGLLYNEGQQYTIMQFRGFYYPFTNDANNPISAKSVLAKEGHYKIKLIGYNDAGKSFTTSQDIFVDNTMPNQFDVQVDGEKAGNPFIEYKEGQQTVGMEASINDKAVDVMKAAGLKADQSLNKIGYWYDNPFSPTGKLSVDENGKLKDEIPMKPNGTMLDFRLAGIDQATNSYGQKQYYFVKDTTPYVYGQPNTETRLNRVNAHIGDTITVTLTANNMNKVKQAAYNFTTNTVDTNIVDIKLNPAAQAQGGQLNATTTNLSGTFVKSDVNVTFDGSKEVTGDIPMVDVTIKIPDMKDIKTISSFKTVTSTFTSVDNSVTKPFTYIAPITILPNFASTLGYIRAEAFFTAGGLMAPLDYPIVGANVTIQDSQGKQYQGTVNKLGQVYITGLPVTRDELIIIQDIPGHFTTYNKFTNAFNTMDDYIYGINKGIGVETIDTAIGGDVNKDNVIDIMDALAIQTDWGTNKRSADINFDGTVDAKDFAFVEKNFEMQNPTVDNAPKAAKTFKGKTLAAIKSALGIQ